MKRKLLLYCDVYPSETASEMRKRAGLESWGVTNKMEADLKCQFEDSGGGFLSSYWIHRRKHALMF